MTADSDKAQHVDYVFTRDYKDNNRINLHHYQWKDTFGYLAHPSIPLKEERLRIADVGTGTGIWLTSLSPHVAGSTQLDGFDVSFEATPPREWLPPNVTFYKWDARTEPEERLQKQYDLVHIRMFVFVLSKEDASLVLRNLIKLLRPGGFLQWGEPDIASFRIEKTRPGNTTNALTQLLKESQSQDRRLSPEWVCQLPQMFSDVGLENVQSDVKEAPPHLALAMHECNLTIHELVARKANNKAFIDRLESLMPQVAKETRDGCCWAFSRWTVVGQSSND